MNANRSRVLGEGNLGYNLESALSAMTILQRHVTITLLPESLHITIDIKSERNGPQLSWRSI